MIHTFHHHLQKLARLCAQALMASTVFTPIYILAIKMVLPNFQRKNKNLKVATVF